MNGLESIRYRSFQLREKLALITGASGGIGRALSLGFAEAGARLALVTRRSSNLDELRKALPDSTEVEVYEIDLSAGAATSRLIADVVARQDALDILINCAGVPLTKDAIDVSEEDWNAVVDVNLKSLYFLCTAAGSIMAGRRYGKIINLSSTYATTTAPGKSLYALTKAAVEHLTRSLAVEWADKGIRVNALAPCLTETPTRSYLLDDPARLSNAVARIPLGRLARPDDLVGPALFLASEASDFVTGHSLRVDGGWTANG